MTQDRRDKQSSEAVSVYRRSECVDCIARPLYKELM